MVEINNQRKAFLDMLAWSEGTDNGRQKPEIMVMTSLWAESYLLIISDHFLQNLSMLNPKLKINRRRTLRFFPVGGMPTASSLAWKTSLRKSGRCGIAAD